MRMSNRGRIDVFRVNLNKLYCYNPSEINLVLLLYNYYVARLVLCVSPFPLPAWKQCIQLVPEEGLSPVPEAVFVRRLSYN